MSRAVFLIGVLLLSGCGTILDAGNLAGADEKMGSPGPHLYGGVRFDALVLADPGDHATSVAFLFFLDMPLSLALDTAFLVFTVPWAIFGPDPPPK